MRFQKITGVVVASAIAVPAPFARAQDSDAVQLDPLIITGARADRKVSETPSTVQVIERAEIQKQLELSPNPTALLAKIIPGYSVSNQTVSSASEGFRGRDALIMLDGVPLTTPLRDVNRIQSMIDLNTVERIEVVAGASSLYGSGATGGTINFITRKPEEGKVRVTTNTAIRAFTSSVQQSLAPEGSVTVSGKQNGFDFIGTATGKRADRAYDGGGREMPSDAMLGQGGADRYENSSLFGKIGSDFGSGKRIELSALHLYFDQMPDYLTNYSLPHARPNFSRAYTGESVREDTKSFSARYSDREFALGSLSLLGFYNDISKRFNYSAFDPVYNSSVYYSGNIRNPTAWFNQTELNVERGGGQLTIDTPLDAILPRMKLTWGGDASIDRTRQATVSGLDVLSPMEQKNYAGFAQLEVPVGPQLTVRGGLRYEMFDLTVDNFVRPTSYLAIPPASALLPALPVIGGEFQYDATTYNFGAVFRITEQLEMFGGYSQGYALPDVGAFTRRAGANSTSAAQILQFACPPGNILYPVHPAVPNNFNCTTSRTVNYSSLAPEPQIVENWEAGFRYSGPTMRGSLAGFISDSDNGVNFDPATNTVAQQKERIYGVELTAEIDVTASLTLGTAIGYREGVYDTNKDGAFDSHLPNNRISSPIKGVVYGNYRFDNGVVLRVEGEGFSERDVKTAIPTATNPTGSRFEIDGAALMHLSLSAPLWDGTAYLGVQNVFDTSYENPTATSVRNLPVYGLGRTVTLGYRKTW